MTPADRKPFIEILMAFAELKRQQLSAPAMELYWRSMQRWTLDEFRTAAEELLRTCEFMPMPKNFEDLRKAGRPTAGEAWIKALKYARDGYWRWEGGGISKSPNATPRPDDPLLDRAVQALGGYETIAMSRTDQTPFLERRFCEHYESMRDADEIRIALPQIASNDNPRLNGPRKLFG